MKLGNIICHEYTNPQKNKQKHELQAAWHTGVNTRRLLPPLLKSIQYFGTSVYGEYCTSSLQETNMTD